MNKSLLYIAIALMVGLGIGYLIFGGSANKEALATHDHPAEEDTQMWTCSMHPQILREEPGDCPICGMELIPAASHTSGLSANQFKLSENALALADIQTTVVGRSSTTSEKNRLSGKIAVNENELATQPAHFNGRIDALYVNSVGQKVSKGQLVAKVYSPELVAAQQELITASKMKSSQPKLYDAVRNKFKNWMIHGRVLDQIESSRAVITQFPVYAHVSGVVTEISVNEGGHIKNGMPIFKVSNLSDVWAEFDAYESELGFFKVGQKLDITTNAYPDKLLKGTISFIDPILNADTRTATVRTTLPNKDNLLKPGMFVSALVEGGTETQSELMIPASAVLWTGERSLVYIKPNPTQAVFEMREVTLGQKSGDQYAILDGLDLGEEVVTKGTFTVDAAAQLQGRKSMMNSGVNTSVEATVSTKLKLPQKFQTVLKEAIPQYLDLKDAFVASRKNRVSTSAKALRKKLAEVPSDLGPQEKGHLVKIIDMLTAISDGVSLEQQREYFVILNENMVALINAVSGLNLHLYLQKCPMANNSKGAVWLSNSKAIKNPYYGEEMLNCGSIIETFGN